MQSICYKIGNEIFSTRYIYHWLIPRTKLNERSVRSARTTGDDSCAAKSNSRQSVAFFPQSTLLLNRGSKTFDSCRELSFSTDDFAALNNFDFD